MLPAAQYAFGKTKVFLRAAALHTLQRGVVEAVLAARPEPDGFDEYAHAGTFEGYTARQLHWHIRAALLRWGSFDRVLPRGVTGNHGKKTLFRLKNYYGIKKNLILD